MRLIVVLVLALATMILSGLARFMGWRALPTAVLDFVFLTSTASSLAIVIAFEAQRLRRHLDPGSELPRVDRRDRKGSGDDPSDDELTPPE